MEYEGHKMHINNGYYDVYYPDHPNARKNGCVMLQILVAEKMLHRFLYESEVVHHIDGNRLNNDFDNLMVFASNADHAFYHNVLNNKNIDYVLYRVNNVYHCESAYIYFNKNKIVNVNNKRMKPCDRCGTLVLIGSKICNNCAKLDQRKVKRPSRNQLKQDIRTNSFLAIGKKYGVSDNAIRKWCKSYDLPFKVSEIKKIEYKDWKYL